MATGTSIASFDRAARLAAFKVPAHVVFRTGPLPRNPTGKLLKQGLREEAGAALPRP